MNTRVFVTSNWHVGINTSSSCLTKTVFAFKQHTIVMLSNVSKLESAGSSINYSAQLSAAPELPNVKPTFQKNNNVFSGRFIAKLYRRRAKKREKKHCCYSITQSIRNTCFHICSNQQKSSPSLSTFSYTATDWYPQTAVLHEHRLY